MIDKSMKNRKSIHIEVLRIIATYLVLFNHTYTQGMWLYAVPGCYKRGQLGLLWGGGHFLPA